MKVKAQIDVIGSRAYTFPDSKTNEPVAVIEILFKDSEGRLFKTTKRGTEELAEGLTDVIINIIPNDKLRPSVGVIEF